VGAGGCRLRAKRFGVLELRRRWRDGTTHIIFEPVELLERLAALVPRPRVKRPANRTWAELMQRSFGYDVLACARCGGRLHLVALIQSPAVITRILRHLQFPEARPTMRPSRDSPLALREMDGGAVFAE
jgi:hypothetical protein